MLTHDVDVEQLATAHWRYVASVLRTHGEAEAVIAKCGHHYRAAFVHGWKHAEEARPPRQET